MAKKRFSPEFIQSIVQEVVSGKAQVAVARKYDLSPKTVNRWCVNHRASLDKGELVQVQEIRRLRVEVRRLQEENEFLKKASAYFASRP